MKVLPKYHRPTARHLAVGLMLLLWTALSVLSVSHSLHQWLHHDSDNAKHSCLVTLASKGQLLGGASTAVFLAPVVAVFISPTGEIDLVLPVQLDFQALGRAPPLVSSVPTLR